MHHFAFNYWNLGFIFKTAIHLRLEVHPLAPSLPLRLAGTEWRSDAKIHHSWTAWSWHMWQRWSGEFGWWFMQFKKLNYTWIQTVLRWLVLRITSSGLSVNPLRSQNEVSKDCLSTPARQATHDNVWPLHYDRERTLHWTFDLDVIVHELEIITVYDQIILIAYELGNMVFELFWTEHHDT